MHLYQNHQYGTVIATSEEDAAAVWTEETGESGGNALQYGWTQTPDEDYFSLVVPIGHSRPSGAKVERSGFIQFANIVTATAQEWVEFRGRGRLA